MAWWAAIKQIGWQCAKNKLTGKKQLQLKLLLLLLLIRRLVSGFSRRASRPKIKFKLYFCREIFALSVNNINLILRREAFEKF